MRTRDHVCREHQVLEVELMSAYCSSNHSIDSLGTQVNIIRRSVMVESSVWSVPGFEFARAGGKGGLHAALPKRADGQICSLSLSATPKGYCSIYLYGHGPSHVIGGDGETVAFLIYSILRRLMQKPTNPMLRKASSIPNHCRWVKVMKRTNLPS